MPLLLEEMVGFGISYYYSNYYYYFILFGFCINYHFTSHFSGFSQTSLYLAV